MDRGTFEEPENLERPKNLVKPVSGGYRKKRSPWERAEGQGKTGQWMKNS